MTTLYVSRRRPEKRSTGGTFFKHHVAWGIVCLLLVSLMAGLWTRTQSLESQNAKLRSQLVAQEQPPDTCKVTTGWQSNTTKQFSLVTSNGTRDYLVHTPADFKSDSYYPLVMFYPGKGASATDAAQAFGLDNLPAVLVYPFPTNGVDGYTAWQGAPYSSKANDVEFTGAVLDKVQGDLCIDKTRVYAVGMSNGGAFAALLSCKLSHRFAAYAVVSGAMYYPDGGCKPPRPTPLITIHGTNDDIVPFDGSEIRKLPSVYDWTATRAAIDKCGPPATTYPNASMVVTDWATCHNGAAVQHIQIIGGNHSWGQVPNDSVWQFLSRFTL